MSRADARVPRPLGVSQEITVAATSGRTPNGVGNATERVMIYSSVDAYYVFGGSTVTATTAHTFIPAGAEHFVTIAPGSFVAAIRRSDDGFIEVSEFGS
jgi:hypothetical protein